MKLYDNLKAAITPFLGTDFYKEGLTRKVGMFAVIFFLVGIISSAWLALDRIEKRVRQQTVSTLEDVLQFTHKAIVDIWVKGQISDATSIFASPILLQNTKTLLSTPQNPNVLLGSPAQENIRKYFRERLKQHDALGIFIISPRYINIASMRDENIGVTNVNLIKRLVA